MAVHICDSHCFIIGRSLHVRQYRISRLYPETHVIRSTGFQCQGRFFKEYIRNFFGAFLFVLIEDYQFLIVDDTGKSHIVIAYG